MWNASFGFETIGITVTVLVGRRHEGGNLARTMIEKESGAGRKQPGLYKWCGKLGSKHDSDGSSINVPALDNSFDQSAESLR